ncbi:MAG: hypothetical protein KC621_12360 [Myxococcales bacterium]|nr:hypothetical protein [Myxococcales bacterium]
MRILLLPAILVACAPEEVDALDLGAGAMSDALADAEASSVSLRAPLTIQVDAIMPGQPFDVTVGALAAGETAYLGYSLYGTGNGPCPPAMGGQCLNLLSPVVSLGTAVADARGTATFHFAAPANVPPGMQVSFQSVAIRGIGGAQTVKSPAVTEIVGAAQTTDVFRHTPAAVDLLFVVDDSCSMYDEQQRLVTSFTSSLGLLSGWGLSMHVGVVTTDMSDPTKSGKLQRDAQGQRYIDDNTANPVQSFSQMASVGTFGSGIEQGLDAVYASLRVQTQTNAGFRRADAQYAVIVLSDERDQSQINSQQAAALILGEEAWPGDASFSSIVTQAGYDAGVEYMDVTNTVGGVIEDINVPDYAPALDDLTQTWYTSEPYVLSAVPSDPTQIHVAVDGVAVPPVAWVYEASANTVRFTGGYAPQAGAGIEVSY